MKNRNVMAVLAGLSIALTTSNIYAQEGCRGMQCPPPQELVDEFDRNNKLLGALNNDAMQVCPQAHADAYLKYSPQDQKCLQRMPDRTAVGKCANANVIKWAQEVKAKAKKLCNVDLRP